MRILLGVMMMVAATPAMAHIGHIGELGGHEHWIALGGIAIATGIALWGARKKPKDAPARDDAARADDAATPDDAEHKEAAT